MARYQVGGAEYEISDSASPEQLEAILKQLAAQEKEVQANYGTLDFSTDMAQKLFGKGTEAIGRATGLTGVEQFGSNVVTNQEAQMRRGNYQPTYTGSLSDTYKDGGISSAIGWIGEKALENSVSGGVALAGTAAAVATAPFSLTASAVLGGSTLVGSAILGTGEAALEAEGKTGEYDETTAIGTGILIGILDKFGAGKVIPKSKLANMTGTQVVNSLLKAGKFDAARAVGNRIVKAGIAEGVTETGQQGLVMGQAAAQGAEYTPKELADAGLESFAIGSALGGGTRAGVDTVAGVAGTASAVKSGVKGASNKLFNKERQITDPQAASDLANRLQTIASENKFDLKDVTATSAKGAKATVSQAHVQLNNELKVVKDTLKAQLQINRKKDSQELIDKKTLAASGLQQARNLTKNTTGKSEFDALSDLVGNSQEGQNMLSIIRQLNELTELHNAGYQGGISQFTDSLNPLGFNSGYDRGALAANRVSPVVSGSAALATGGASLIGQLGAVGAGRGIDKLTGRRSRVARYIDQNRDNQGVQQQQMPSILQAYQNALQKTQAEKAEDIQLDRAMHNDLFNRNQAPNGSPQAMIVMETGLNPQTAVQILRGIDNPQTNKFRDEAIRFFEFGGKLKSLNKLKPLLESEIQKQNAQRDFEPQAQQTQQSQSNEEAVKRGKQGNLDFIQNIRDAVNEAQIDLSDKAKILAALKEFELPLGTEPITKVNSIIAGATNNAKTPEVILRFLQPYQQRVIAQQFARRSTT